MTLDDTWFATDLPVLEAVVSLIDEGTRTVQPLDVARAIAHDVADVERSMGRLDGEYLVLLRERMQGSPGVVGATGVTPAARRAVGQWPSGESLADRVLAELDERVEAAEDPDERSKFVKARDALAGMGRDIFVDVAGRALSRSMGGL